MACANEIECLGDYCSCGELELSLIADEIGVWRMKAQFNGVTLSREIEVEEGENIIIPNIFNENYTHVIWFEKADGSMFRDKKFSINIKPCVKV
jgi:hypothetical protein